MNKIVLITLMLVIFSCKNNQDKRIIGLYKIDKYNTLNKENTAKDYEYLKLNPKGTFDLFYNRIDTIGQIRGSWKVIKAKKKDEFYISFEYENNVVEGVLRNNIFYFTYPNDFHKDKYKNVLYVKCGNVSD